MVCPIPSYGWSMLIIIWGVLKMGDPQVTMVFGLKCSKMDDLGVPEYFGKHPINISIHIMLRGQSGHWVSWADPVCRDEQRLRAVQDTCAGGTGSNQAQWQGGKGGSGCKKWGNHQNNGDFNMFFTLSFLDWDSQVGWSNCWIMVMKLLYR